MITVLKKYQINYHQVFAAVWGGRRIGQLHISAKLYCLRPDRNFKLHHIASLYIIFAWYRLA